MGPVGDFLDWLELQPPGDSSIQAVTFLPMVSSRDPLN